jgi:hypothetical protein
MQALLWQNAILWFTLGGLVGAPAGWAIGWTLWGPPAVSAMVKLAIGIDKAGREMNVLIHMITFDVMQMKKARTA